ncbi:hypothetical protein [Lentzea sp. NPDC060358]|uniref:hypothetical protein n=1 Tax=Lentzea sp. NPDC060358 TaxID=3347103 RepID=UPI0036564956
MTHGDSDPRDRLNRLWSRLSGPREEALAAYREVEALLAAEVGIAHEPLVTTSMPELRAATEGEFIAMLRMISVRSGLTVREISRRAGGVLPRSQVYSLFQRGKLPTKPGQVRTFVTICGLRGPQVARVMALWVALRERAVTTSGA